MDTTPFEIPSTKAPHMKVFIDTPTIWLYLDPPRVFLAMEVSSN